MADRSDPMVQAWIDEDVRVNGNEAHEDCFLCGWPHAKNLLCNGAPFGLAIIGGEYYTITKQNVDSMLRFRRDSPSRGFHWRNDVSFERTEAGVRISRIEQFNGVPQMKTWLIPLLEWESIVSALDVSAAQSSLLQRSFEAGWVQCATWAERDDLITDCDSDAYARERDAALAKLASGVPAADATAVPLDPETGKPWTPVDQAAWEAAERVRTAGLSVPRHDPTSPRTTDGGAA